MTCRMHLDSGVDDTLLRSELDHENARQNRRNPNRRAIEKRVADIEAHSTERAKKLDVTF